jgi:hypothetical protein
MSGASIGFFFLPDMVMNCYSLPSATVVICAALLSLSVGGLCSCGVAGVGAHTLDLPLLELLLVGLLGAGVAFCYRCIWWSLAIIEATCFSSLQIRLVLVACKESSAFSIHLTCRESCRMRCLLESVRAMLNVVVLVVVSAGRILGCFCNPAKAGILWLEGLGAGVDSWEVSGGEPMERDELCTPKES